MAGFGLRLGKETLLSDGENKERFLVLSSMWNFLVPGGSLSPGSVVRS
jgi:hypothetical protein